MKCPRIVRKAYRHGNVPDVPDGLRFAPEVPTMAEPELSRQLLVTLKKGKDA